MADKFKRSMAMLLATLMVMSQVAIPVSAETDPNPELTLDFTPTGDEKKTPPEPTTTTTTETKTNPDNSTTTTTTTTTTDPANHTVTETVTEKTESSSSTGSTSTASTDINSTTNSLTTPPSTTENGTTSTTIATSKTESTFHEDVNQTQSGDVIDTVITGSSSSETTTQTTTTNVTEDVVTNIAPVDGTGPEVPTDTGLISTEASASEVPDTDVTADTTVWEEGIVTNENKFGTEFIVKGETTTIDKELTKISTTTVTLTDASGKVVLNMTPNGTDEEKRNVTLTDIMKGTYPNVFDPSSIEGGANIQYEEKTAENGSKYMEGSNGKGVTVRFQWTENGWIITKITETAGARGEEYTTEEDISSEISPDTTPSESSAYPEEYAAKAQAYKDNGKTVTNTTQLANGTQTDYAYMKELTDDEGNVTGYQDVKETETVTTETTYYDIDNDTANYPTISDEDAPQVTTGFVMPDSSRLPTAGTTQNPDGTTTVVTVMEMIDTKGEFTTVGQPMGYTISTITYDADGNPLKTNMQKLYGTASTTTTTTTIDPTTMEITTTTTVIHRDIEEIRAKQHSRDVDVLVSKNQDFKTTVVTEQDAYQLVETAGGMFFLYQGQMFAVEEMENHGTTTNYDVASGSTVDLDTYGKSDDIQNNGYANWKGEKNDHLLTGDGNTKTDTKEDGTYTHVGAGYVSTFFLEDGKGKLHQAQQFMIKDGNKIRYVYCVELNTSATGGAYKVFSDKSDNNKRNDIGNIDNQKKNDKGEYEDYDNYITDDNAENLRSVAINGFWGTEAGIGSLSAVKDLLRRNNLGTVADSITAGEALAATQAAFWEYGSATDAKFSGSFVALDNNVGRANTNGTNIVALKNLLVSLAGLDASDGRTGAAQAINKDSVTGSSITLNNQVSDGNGGVKQLTQTITKKDNTTETITSDAYNTDVSFTLAVSNTSINGNMTVTLSQGDRKIGTYRLAGEDAGLISSIGRVRADGNGVYTIPGVEIAEGVEVTLKLEGTQHLDDGIYIYNNERLQDFVGLASKDHNVALKFGLKFNVTDPSFNDGDVTTTGYRDDKAVSTKMEKRTDTTDVTYRKNYTEDSTSYEQTRTILATETVITVEDTRTKEEMTWEEYRREYVPTPINDEDGGGNVPLLNELLPMEANGLNVILDEAVPLAAAPATGDGTVLWGAMGLLSMIGSSFLGRKKKEDEEA